MVDPVARLVEVIQILRGAGTPVACATAAQLQAHLDTGAPLEKLLGLAVGRGGAHEKAHRRARREQRDHQLRELAADISGGVTRKARGLAEMMLSDDPKTQAFRHAFPDAPASVPQFVRILRGAP